MRIRLAFEAPLPAYKCWFEVPEACKTVHDLQKAIRKGFKLDDLCKTTRLDLDGFYLLPTSSIAGSLNDSDLLNVMIKRKSDVLPPKSLPVAGGKKRSRDDAFIEQSNAKKQKTSKSGSVVPQAQKQKQGQKQARTPNQKTTQGSKNNNNSNNNKKNSKEKNSNQAKPQKTPPTNVNQQSKQLNKNQAKKVAKPAVNKNASQAAKARATSIASSSSDSDSDSDSNSDSDSDSSSGSSSSSESDTSCSSSSDDEDDPKPSTAPRPPPGQGSKQTKQRNARKRFANAQGQPQTQPKEQPLPKDQQIKQPEAAPKPKVVMTTVQLNDGPVRKQQPRNAKPNYPNANHHNNEQPNGQAKHDEQLPNGKTRQKNNTESQQSSKEIKVKETLEEPTPAVEEDTTPRDYDALPRLEGNPNAGDTIAYKTLEMDASYNPVISDFKEAVVLSFSEGDNSAEVQLTPRFRTHVELDGDGLPVLGKFDIYDKDEQDRTLRGIVTLDLLSLADCRHIRQ
ncbi:hypothetical protein BGZ82_009032 [Podila clonocystis]|nr:hypothetical protein BGZ82_009032 [Podila clonocystis]